MKGEYEFFPCYHTYQFSLVQRDPMNHHAPAYHSLHLQKYTFLHSLFVNQREENKGVKRRRDREEEV